MKAAALLCLLIAGCAHHVAWYREGGDAEALYKDNAGCRAYSAGAGMTTEYLYRQCMASKGWHDPDKPGGY